ncbi:MAG: DUF11 domain-containing protein [Phycisphaerae bacterium]|nr:DUF11 domain-containing protein [Phycisphaerae bacterium]
MPVNAEGEYIGTAPHARPSTGWSRSVKLAPPDRSAEAAPAPAPAPAAAPAPRAAATTGDVMYIPTGERSTSALMVEKIFPRTVSVGQPFEYTIKTTNISGMTLNNVTVNEVTPTNFTVQSVTPQGSNGSFNLGNLNPGESKSIIFKGAAAGTGTINACASANYTFALCHTINVVQPALAITKTITPEAILNCTPINMTVEVKNTGSGEAMNVRVTDQLPAGLTLANGGTSFDEAIGNLPAGASRTITKELKAASVGRYENMASTKADGINAVNSNRVAVVVKQPKLEITCKAGGQVMMGRDACYEMTVSNKGDAVSNNTKVTATLPAGVTVSNAGEGAATGGSYTVNVGSLAAGASKTFRFCLRTNTIQPLNVSATATGDCSAPANTNCSINVYGVADIGTLVTDLDGVVPLGDPHTYQVAVKNQGQIQLTNTRMVVTLPAGIQFLSSPLGKLEGNKVVFNFGTIAPGDTVNSNFVVKGVTVGEHLVIGETTANEIKTPVRDDELTAFFEK